MHPHRTHTCADLRAEHIGQVVRLSGWVHRVRDHGGVLFIDLRDAYGVTQCVVDEGSPLLADAARWRVESVLTLTGPVAARPEGTANPDMPTGAVELRVEEAVLRSAAAVLPFQVAEDDGAGEEARLRYRYLDLRRPWMADKVRLRSRVIADIRRRMWDAGFHEFQTPILTASSPEGARDFLVPSRLHPGKFYALPQAPQQFKQLLMIAGFDRYFQIAPCFRDEDSRASRLAEHYQLDVEMSFITQDDLFATMEPVVAGVFAAFGGGAAVTPAPWPRITYKDAMARYGSDKPDLRNPLEIVDVTDIFQREDVAFKAFKGVTVRAIRAPGVSDKPRSFFDKLNAWAQGEGAAGMGYILRAGAGGKGPIAKFLPEGALGALYDAAGAHDGDAVFFIAGEDPTALAGRARDAICDAMGVREEGVYTFCWVVDFPLYERDEKTGKVEFSHNPFSMPQGGLDALNTQDPLAILAHQYDCVCNGHELSSGAIRNHDPAIMERAFAIAGYGPEVLEARFGGMLNAMRFGAPPHGGCAFGIDRILMLLAGEDNLREVNAFVMNGQYEDPMMGAPSAVDAAQLADLHIRVVPPVKGG
ncbi:MAG TPA: aspartate--tRNA ligase [Rhodospirillaceae bacterium]|jgi:aspartyl-tRNA synthetase|nr:aspartate--tRNA ligase [Alphaproteobacteria bacterium]HBH27118.1 aspartate--tRNA ligase [Rhodospirillaceae bacterium]